MCWPPDQSLFDWVCQGFLIQVAMPSQTSVPTVRLGVCFITWPNKHARRLNRAVLESCMVEFGFVFVSRVLKRQETFIQP